MGRESISTHWEYSSTVQEGRGQCLEGERVGGHYLGDKADIDDCTTEGNTLERGWLFGLLNIYNIVCMYLLSECMYMQGQGQEVICHS